MCVNNSLQSTSGLEEVFFLKFVMPFVVAEQALLRISLNIYYILTMRKEKNVELFCQNFKNKAPI